MAVHAHPDDEASGGGILAAYSDQDVRVVVVTCTNGEFGDAPGGIKPGQDGHDPDTVARIERSLGTLGTAAIAAMDAQLPWFRKLSAENRSWLGLVAQAGIASFVDWVKHPGRMRPAATEVFGTAPRELARAVSLQHAVEMVRVIIDVVEGQVDVLAAPGGEAELREAVLVYAREIAFSAAQVYARTAEARGMPSASRGGTASRPPASSARAWQASRSSTCRPIVDGPGRSRRSWPGSWRCSVPPLLPWFCPFSLAA